MKYTVIVAVFVLLIIIGYLNRFRAKNIFQGSKDQVWFPVQPHENMFVAGCNVWFFNNNSSRVILYCHGNYGNMSYYSHMPLMAKHLGLSLIMFDYRGFGASEGIPTTDTIKEDGLNIYRWLTDTYDESNIIVWGESLGGSIASWIACNNNPSKLVLVSTFSDIHDVIKMHSKDSYLVHAVIAVADMLYDSLPIKQWIKKIKVPICIVHSTQDTYIPFTCAIINAQSSNYIKEFIPINGDHTTPSMTEQDLQRLSNFLDVNVCYRDVMEDLTAVRQHSPLCRL